MEDEATTLAEELPRYFRAAGLPEDGGRAARWVWFRLAGIPLCFPNFGARRRVVRYHDLHHLLTGYRTDWTGEAEIAAWEIASGCGRHWVAWMFNLPMLGIALLFAPRVALRAWSRGRRSRNYYGSAFEPLLQQTVGTLRAHLRLDRDTRPTTWAERMSFAAWSMLGLTLTLAPVGGLAFGIAWLL